MRYLLGKESPFEEANGGFAAVEQSAKDEVKAVSEVKNRSSVWGSEESSVRRVAPRLAEGPSSSR
jgi:hypothetical protein